MSEIQIEDSDKVSRSVYAPKDYKEGVLDLGSGLMFQSKDNPKDSYRESVNCNRLLGDNPNKIHELGQAKLQKDNQVLIQKGREPRTYAGFASANVGNIRNDAKSGDVSFEVHYSPILENNAHCDIVLMFTGTKPVKAHRTAAIAKLCDCFNQFIAA